MNENKPTTNGHDQNVQLQRLWQPRDRTSLDTLTKLVNELAGEFRLSTLLQRILRSAVELLGCTSGSICMIDQDAQTYRKEIDLEEGCQAGTIFPLSEGLTGTVAKTGKPVILRRYAEVKRGHIYPHEPRYHRAVIGVPIKLKSDLIGACLVFASSDEQVFDEDDAQLLQRFAIHAAIAIANSRLHTEAAERAKEAAVSAERERSMLEIHDTVGRGLAAVMLRLEEAYNRVGAGQDPCDAIRDAQRVARSALEDGRRSLWGTGASRHAARPVDEAIRLECDWAQATSGVATNLRVFGDRQEISAEVNVQLIRIVQESLTNVAQHAGARTVRVGLVYGSDGVAVIVEDDGCGFDVQEVDSAVKSTVGLPGLVARARQVGGRIQIDSTPGWGTRIRADLPYRVQPSESTVHPRLRVLIVHDQPAMRAGLVQLLNHSEPVVHVVAELGEVAAVKEAVRLLHPDVVLAGMRLCGAPSFVAGLREEDTDLPVVGIMDEAAELQVREWAAAGVNGFIPKDVDATSLGRAVMAAARGDVMVTGGVLEQLGGLPVLDPAGLTQREREVRQLLEQGLPDKRIATALGISVKTVEKHVGNVLRKECVHSRTELMARLGQ